MLCPVCTTERLVMADRQGIEIDYCPTCRGVWLDRGELDKLIEKSSAQVAQASTPAYPSEPERPRDHEPRPYPREYRDDPRDYRHDDRYRHRKRKSLLGDIFDFD